MAYATPAQLATWMSLPPFDTELEARAELKLDVATGLIDDEIGQSLELSETVDDLDGTGTSTLVLSRWPVDAVTSVVVNGVTLTPGTDYEVEEAGLLNRKRCVWRCDDDVLVTYTAGYNPIPFSIVGLVLELASGSWMNVGGKKSERIADYQVAFVREGMSLSTADKKQLGRYASNR